MKKYSDYIRYPIIMQMSHQVPNPDKEGETVTEVADETLNSMVPLWRKAKSELKPEDYNAFYKQRFGDYEDPVDVMHFKTEVKPPLTPCCIFLRTRLLTTTPRNLKKGWRYTPTVC